MIEIIYNDGHKEIFEIYNHSKTHVIWEDYACNFIRINKNTGKASILVNKEWIEYDLQIKSYRIINNIN